MKRVEATKIVVDLIKSYAKERGDRPSIETMELDWHSKLLGEAIEIIDAFVAGADLPYAQARRWLAKACQEVKK